MSTRRLISSGSPFESAFGYSRAVVDGDYVFISGTTGYDYATMTMPEDVAAIVRFLCGSAARYVTGQAIHSNGGAYLGA